MKSVQWRLVADRPEIIISGLVRDCARSLPRLLKSFVKLGRKLPAWRYIFIENGSVDGSREILNAFHARHGNGQLLALDGLEAEFPQRTHRLAHLRNMTHDLLFDRLGSTDGKYLLLLDMDGANSWVDTHRIARLVRHDDGSWAGIFANQSRNYYDLWSLRHPVYGPTDVWKEVRERPAGMTHEEAVDAFVKARRFSLPPDMGRIRVDSAFGGLGLYRLADITGCRYVGLDEEGEEICEHVDFHRDVRRRGGRLYIDTALINGSGVQPHDYEPSRFKLTKQAVRRQIARIRNPN